MEDDTNARCHLLVKLTEILRVGERPENVFKISEMKKTSIKILKLNFQVNFP